jgi:hypothetical protein
MRAMADIGWRQFVGLVGTGAAALPPIARAANREAADRVFSQRIGFSIRLEATSCCGSEAAFRAFQIASLNHYDAPL